VKQETTCKRGSAFISTSKGFCHLTIKCGRHNFRIMRIRNYTIDADNRREMRQLHQDVVFDWKKIAKQLAGKPELCRRYRSRRLRPAHLSRTHEPFHAVYEPITGTVYANQAGTAATLLDAMLYIRP
jgi:hypothetical protein